MNHSEIAVNKFKEGYNCAQSVLFSYADKLNISKDFALRISNGFGAGMGRKQEVCGAICGGILVLNLLYGRGENDEKQKQDINYSKVRELISRFENIHGTINCRKLLDGCDLLTTEGQEKFKLEKLIVNCYKYVEDTVKILDKIIEE